MNFIKNLLAVYKIHLWAVAICYVIGFFYLQPESLLKQPKYKEVEELVKVSDGDGDYREEWHTVVEYYNKDAGRAYEKAQKNEFDLWTVGYGYLGILLLFSILRKPIMGKIIQLWPSLIEDDGNAVFLTLTLGFPLLVAA